MKGTRLWQDTGSPLISGHSRRQRPFWRDWMQATAVGFAAGTAVLVAIAAMRGEDLLAAATSVWLPALVSAALGALPAVWFAGRLGSVRRWVAGAISASVFAVGLTYLVAVYLVSRLNG